MPPDPFSLAVGVSAARELAQQAFVDIASYEARPAVSLVKQLRTEIKAVGGTPTTSVARLRDAISSVLRRIAGESEGQTRLGRVLSQFGSRVVTASSVLGDADVQSCLQDNEIQRNLVDVAFQTLITGKIDESTAEFGRAVGLCTARLNRGDSFPKFLIEFVTGVVIASVTSGLSFEDDINLTAVHHVSEQIAGVQNRLEELGSRMGGAPLATAECRKVLDAAVILRFQEPELATSQVIALARRVIGNGDLNGAEPSIRAQVLYWAARLSEGRRKDRPLSEYFLTHLTNTGIEVDRRVIDALRLRDDGKQDESLAALSAIQTPDARSVFVAQLAEYRGRSALTSWFELQSNLQTGDLLPVGWAQIAVAYANEQQFDRAIQLISALSGVELDSFPQILLLRGRCVSRATFPRDAWAQLGEHTLHNVNAPALQTADARAARSAAVVDFRAAESAFAKLGFEPGVRVARAEIAWCEVNDPRRRSEASEVIKANLDLLEFAAPFVELADRFRIPIDTGTLDRQVGLRFLSGGLRTPEVGTYIALLRQKRDYSKLATYLTESAQQLRSSTIPGAQVWALLLWESLLETGAIDKARTHLDENRESFGEAYERCLAVITERAGEDPVPVLRAKYASSGDFLDLSNLCVALRSRGDSVGLEVAAEELVRARPTPEYIALLCECYLDLNKPRAVLDLLDQHETTVEIAAPLRRMRASALYVLGRFRESTALAEQLLGERHTLEALRFAIQSAVLSGDRDTVRRLVRRELDRTPVRASEDLALLATVCDTQDQATALEIARENVAAAPDNPTVLTAAYTLATRLGREDVGHEWLTRAAELSGTEGPVVRRGLKETIEYMRERGEATNRIWSLVVSCEVPLQLALARTNRTLSEVIVGGGRGQVAVRDPRKRGLIPLGHGGHGRVDLSNVQSLGVDVGSLLLAQVLGVLERVLRRFPKILLPWSVFWFLYREKQQNGFHQPSQIVKARDALSFCTDANVGVVEFGEDEGSWLREEVGQELGSLLPCAERDSGVVIGQARPMKVSSLGEEQANIKEHAKRLGSMRDLIVLLRQEGAISAGEESKALAYLAAVEPETGVRAPLPPTTMRSGPILLTELAITYLHFLGLLDRLRSIARPLFVHRAALDEWREVVDFEARANVTAADLDALWASLLAAQESGKAVLLPSLNQDEPSDGEPQPLSELMADVGDMQALWVDDRCVGGLQTVTDRTGCQRPLVSVVDVIREVRRSGHMSAQEATSALLELRRFGYFVFQIEEEELSATVGQASDISTDGSLAETADLKTLRQYVTRLRATTFLKLPAEDPFLAELQRACTRVLTALWVNPTDSIDLIKARANWVVSALYPFAIDWRHVILNADNVSWPEVGAAELAQLIAASPTIAERVAPFREWFAETVVRQEQRLPGVSKALGQLLARRLKPILEGDPSGE